MSDFTIENALVCDDVRRELNNKDILIGVYSSGINVPSLPVNVNLCFWMIVSPKKVGPLTLEFKIELPGTANPVQIKVEANVPPPIKNFAISTPQASYPILQTGEIKLFVRPFGNDRWRLIYRLNVDYQPPTFNPYPNVSPPPS